jgi:ATP-dependent Clp endopeptidase proteolytic subunit ClpP
MPTPKILGLKERTPSSTFQIKAKSATKAEIIIYEQIGASFWDGGISAKQFSEEMKKIEASVTEITVRINSPGGDVFDGVAIYNRLKQHKAKKIIYVDGLAASIASVIALAGDEIIMSEGSLFMIHLPWTWAMGNRKDIENTLDRLAIVEDQIVNIYAKKTGMSRDEIKQKLEAETWMDADESIELGFADKKSEEESLPIAASVFDKSKWINKAPKNYRSETVAIDKAKAELNKKIQTVLNKK